MCWTLPAEGFEALLSLETSVVPGLPRLARDMANDKMLAAEFRGSSLADQASVPLLDGDEGIQHHVVVPGLAGIIFATAGQAAAVTAGRRGGNIYCSSSSSNACVRTTVVLARLERAKGTTVRRFVLQDCSAFRRDDVGAGSRTKAGGNKRGNTMGTTVRVSLPVKYAALLEEATASYPSPGDCPFLFQAILEATAINRRSRQAP